MDNTKYRLPDNSEMILWQDETEYTKVYYVDQNAANASDDNEGSKDAPFQTIGAAAKIVKAGEKVIIKEGIYRETVRNEHFGESQKQMICFEGAEGERVEITGGEIFRGKWEEAYGWKRTHPYARETEPVKPGKIYMGKLPREAFVGNNPFLVINGPSYLWYHLIPKMFYAKEKPQHDVVASKSGMLFCDGERMKQVISFFELYEDENTFFVEPDGLTVHLHLKGNENPQDHIIEYTARDQCFCPEHTFGAYIHLKNLIFTKAGNSFPPAQRGAVSANCGHHFMIEKCRVEDANSVGIDVGCQTPYRLWNGEHGFTQVFDCVVKRCGITGIAGTCGGSDTHHYLDMQQEGMAIYRNKVTDCCYHNFEQLWENSAIKLHHMKNSIIADNYVSGMAFGAGIWADASNSNLSISGNVVLHSTNEYGALFLEASLDENHISHNIVIDSKHNPAIVDKRGGSGIYSHQCDDVKNYRNITLQCDYAGIAMMGLPPSRISHGYRGRTGYGMEFKENVIGNCAAAMILPNERGQSEGNIFGGFLEGGYMRIEEPNLFLNMEACRKWFNWDMESVHETITGKLDEDGRMLMLRIGEEEICFDLHGNIREQIDSFWTGR